jgi:hypothetical protein
VLHLARDNIEDPKGEDVTEDEWCGIARPLGVGDVAKRESVQAYAEDGLADTVEGEECDPRDDPNGEEHVGDHPKEAYKDVGVEAILAADIVVVEAPDFEWPLE